MNSIKLVVSGEKVSRSIRRITRKEDGFYGWVKVGGKEVKARKNLGKGNRMWHLA